MASIVGIVTGISKRYLIWPGISGRSEGNLNTRNLPIFLAAKASVRRLMIMTNAMKSLEPWSDSAATRGVVQEGGHHFAKCVSVARKKGLPDVGSAKNSRPVPSSIS